MPPMEIEREPVFAWVTAQEAEITETIYSTFAGEPPDTWPVVPISEREFQHYAVFFFFVLVLVFFVLIELLKPKRSHHSQ